MRMVTRIYIDGAFVTPHGTEMLDLFDPVRGEVLESQLLFPLQDLLPQRIDTIHDGVAFDIPQWVRIHLMRLPLTSTSSSPAMPICSLNTIKPPQSSHRQRCRGSSAVMER